MRRKQSKVSPKAARLAPLGPRGRVAGGESDGEEQKRSPTRRIFSRLPASPSWRTRIPPLDYHSGPVLDRDVRERESFFSTIASATALRKASMAEVIAYCRNRLSKLASSGDGLKHKFITALVCDLLMTFASCSEAHACALQPLVQVLMGAVYKDIVQYRPTRLGTPNVNDLRVRETFFEGNEALLARTRKAIEEVETIVGRTNRLRQSRTIRQAVVTRAIDAWRRNVLFFMFRSWRRNASSSAQHRNFLEMSFNKFAMQGVDRDRLVKEHVLSHLRRLAMITRLKKITDSYTDAHKARSNLKDAVKFHQDRLATLKSQVRRLVKDYEHARADHFLLMDELGKSEAKRVALNGLRYGYMTETVIDAAESVLRYVRVQMARLSESLVPDMRKMWTDGPFGIFTFDQDHAASELSHSSPHDLLLMWINFHARATHVEMCKAAGVKVDLTNAPEIGNFTTDMRGGRTVLDVLFRIAPPALQRRLESVRRIHEPHERNAKLLEALNACEPQFRGLLSARELMNQEYEGWEPSILISFLARLMCAFPGIPRSGKPDALVQEIDDALVDLDAVREFLRRSQRQSKFYRDEELARKARKASDTPTTSGTVVACDDEKDGAAPGPPQQKGDNPSGGAANAKESDVSDARAEPSPAVAPPPPDATRPALRVVPSEARVFEPAKSSLLVSSVTRMGPVITSPKRIRTPGFVRVQGEFQDKLEKGGLDDAQIEAFAKNWEDEGNVHFSSTVAVSVESVSEFDTHRCFDERDLEKARGGNGKAAAKGKFNGAKLLARSAKKVVNMMKLAKPRRKERKRRDRARRIRHAGDKLSTGLRPAREILKGHKFDYHKWLHDRLAPMLVDTVNEATMWLEEHALCEQLWRATRSRIECYSLRLLQNALRGEPEPLVNHKDVMESSLYTCLTVDNLTYFLSNPGQYNLAAEVGQIRALLAKKQQELKRVFQNYAGVDVKDYSVSTLDTEECSKFVRDSKIANSHLKVADAVAVFNRLCRISSAAVKIQRCFRNFQYRKGFWKDISVQMASTKLNLRWRPSLTPFEFVLSLIEIANLRGGADSLVKRLQILLEIVLVNARQLKVEGFRRIINAARFDAVFESYRVHLRHIFVYFSSKSSNIAQAGTMDETMDLGEWNDLLRTVHMLEPDGPILHDESSTIFMCSRAADYDVKLTASSRKHKIMQPFLTYTQFREALVILACFKYSDPYRSIHEKFTRFLSTEFLPMCFTWINSRAGKDAAKSFESKNARTSLSRTTTQLRKMSKRTSVQGGSLLSRRQSSLLAPSKNVVIRELGR